MERIWEDKKALRRRLAAIPIAEKLAMLDALRERQLVIQKAGERMRAASRESHEG